MATGINETGHQFIFRHPERGRRCEQLWRRLPEHCRSDTARPARRSGMHARHPTAGRDELRDPAAIVAAGAEFHQHPTSEAHNPEADQHKKGRRRRDEEPALYDVHDPSPLASLTRDILPRDILRRWFGGRLYSNGGLFRITPFWCNPLRQTAPPAGVRRANVPLSCSSSQPFSIARRRPDLYSAGVPLI
jgi:hypothetical protein